MSELKLVGDFQADSSVFVASYSFETLPSIIRESQKMVFDHFGIPLNQYVGQSHHYDALDILTDLSPSDNIIFFDVDAVPTRSTLVDEILTLISDGRTLVGIEQNHNSPINSHLIYAGPACFGFTKDLRQFLDSPSFRFTTRGDVAQEFTYRAIEKEVKIEFLKFMSCKEPKWPLDSERMFGVGSFYDGLYHQFEIRRSINHCDFIKECQRICSKI